MNPSDNPTDRANAMQKRNDSMHSAAETIASVWYKDAVRNPHARVFIAWRPARPGEWYSLPLLYRNGDELPEEYRIDKELLSSWTKTHVQGVVYDAMRRLPILGNGPVPARHCD